MSNIQKIQLTDFFAGVAPATIDVDDTKVYMPDAAWTKTFATGLSEMAERGCFTGANVVEIGCGSGIIMAGLIAAANHVQQNGLTYTGLDITRHAVEACQNLAMQEGLDVKVYCSDLLANLSTQECEQTSHLIGCIPQVPSQRDLTDRSKSDYYSVTGIKEDTYGLGLVARLLDQARERVPHASIILNIAGRPGEERIKELYESRGFQAQAVYSRIIRQDPMTSVGPLEEIEQAGGAEFCFYKDPEGSGQICAGEAEALRKSGQPVYHDLFVMKAEMG